jgi:hypothetical protein
MHLNLYNVHLAICILSIMCRWQILSLKNGHMHIPWNHTKFLNLIIRNKIIKTRVLWSVTPCFLAHWYQYFRLTCQHHLQGRRFKKGAAGSFWKFLPACQTTRDHITKSLIYRAYLRKLRVTRTYTETNSFSTNCIIIIIIIKCMIYCIHLPFWKLLHTRRIKMAVDH